MTRHAATLVAAAVLVVSLAAAAVPARAHAAPAKGLVDASLEALPAGSAAAPVMIREIDQRLGARWIRLTISWAVLEPQQGAYSPIELERLDALVQDLHTAGVKIILTVCAAPAWAQDSSLWQNPPV
ncbi:MAG TPA: beta-galactosidase, partial [Thermoleophilia bacterium]|nr:beta-galactosidase [Thermoleophilia bacterium]